MSEFGDVGDTFLAEHNEILDWNHTGRPSNGRIEGTNNHLLLQFLHHRAHDFTNYTNFEVRGILITQSDPADPSISYPKNDEGSTIVICN